MYDLVNNMINYFGLTVIPTSIIEFLPWFVSVCIGIEIVLFVFDSVFYTIRQINKGVR